MQVFKIEYVETVHGYFGAEAETEEEALNRFDDWRYNDDYVYDIMNSVCDIDRDYFINNNANVLTEDILTDYMYNDMCKFER